MLQYSVHFECPGGEVVTLRSAKPTCAGSIPAQDSRVITHPMPGWWNLVDTQDVKFCGRKAVRVQFPPRAH